MPVGMGEELENNLKEEESVEDYNKCKRNSDYKINVDIPNFYGGMHVEEFLDWILGVENFFQYMEILQDKQVKLVAFKLKGAAFAW